jgi:hypothetical protein
MMRTMSNAMPTVPTVIQLIVEDPAGRILLAKDKYDESRFEYLENRLEYAQSLESTAQRLLSQVSETLTYPTLEYFGLFNGAVVSELRVSFRIKLDDETVRPRLKATRKSLLSFATTSVRSSVRSVMNTSSVVSDRNGLSSR